MTPVGARLFDPCLALAIVDVRPTVLLGGRAATGLGDELGELPVGHLMFVDRERAEENFVGRTLDSLVQYEMRGTLDEPRVNPVPLPLPKTILDEIIRGFGIWQALTGSGRTREEPPP